MSESAQALFLIGSAKQTTSNSSVLAGYLAERLAARGMTVKTSFLHRHVNSEKGQRALLEAVGCADVIVLACPLYIDSLPSHVVRALELIATDRSSSPPVKSAQFVGLLNCGFPEAQHNDVALAICRQFAKEAHFTWAGGLALGAGEALGGVPLIERGGMTLHIRQALDLSAEALAHGQTVPAQAVQLMAKPLMPKRAYMLAGAFGWLRRARQNSALSKLSARPYEADR